VVLDLDALDRSDLEALQKLYAREPEIAVAGGGSVLTPALGGLLLGAFSTTGPHDHSCGLPARGHGRGTGPAQAGGVREPRRPRPGDGGAAATQPPGR
jgi:hypothetical protein